MSGQPTCPICHRQTDKLYLLNLEQFSQGYSGGTLLVCEECLKRPDLGSLLSDLSYDALTLEDEDLEG